MWLCWTDLSQYTCVVHVRCVRTFIGFRRLLCTIMSHRAHVSRFTILGFTSCCIHNAVKTLFAGTTDSIKTRWITEHSRITTFAITKLCLANLRLICASRTVDRSMCSCRTVAAVGTANALWWINGRWSNGTRFTPEASGTSKRRKFDSLVWAVKTR